MAIFRKAVVIGLRRRENKWSEDPPLLNVELCSIWKSCEQINALSLFAENTVANPHAIDSMDSFKCIVCNFVNLATFSTSIL